MNCDDKSCWQQLRRELNHCGRLVEDDLDWIDACHDYVRGQVTVLHGSRSSRSQRKADSDFRGSVRRR